MRNLLLCILLWCTNVALVADDTSPAILNVTAHQDDEGRSLVRRTVLVYDSHGEPFVVNQQFLKEDDGRYRVLPDSLSEKEIRLGDEICGREGARFVTHLEDVRISPGTVQAILCRY